MSNTKPRQEHSSNPPEIYIIVKGGVVSSVLANQTARVFILDLDDMSTESDSLKNRAKDLFLEACEGKLIVLLG